MPIFIEDVKDFANLIFALAGERIEIQQEEKNRGNRIELRPDLRFDDLLDSVEKFLRIQDTCYVRRLIVMWDYLLS
jgi:hypothetical protein